MDVVVSTKYSRAHAIYRTVLRLGVAILIELHFLYILFMHVAWELTYRTWIREFGNWLIAAAVGYVIFCAFTEKDFWRRAGRKMKNMFSPEWAIVIYLFVWYLAVCVIRERMDDMIYLRYNSYRLFIAAMSALLMFPFIEMMGVKRGRRYFDWMMHIAMATFTPFCAWATWKFTHLEFITFPSGNRLENFERSVSMMLGNNRNTTGAQAFAMICICLYMILTKEKIVRALYVVAGAVHTMVLILSNSRNSYVALSAMIFATAYLYVWRRLKDKDRAARFLMGLILAVACSVLLHYLRNDILMKFAYIPPAAAEANAVAIVPSHMTIGGSLSQCLPGAFSSHVASRGAAKGVLPVSAMAATQPDFNVRDLSGLSGRPEIWLACFKLMFSSPDKFFLGVTPAHVRKMLYEVGGLAYYMPDAHNGILQVGVCLGVPSMILYIVFLVVLCVRCFRLAFSRKLKSIPNIWVLSAIILGILVMDLVETRLFAHYRSNLIIFYIFAGWVVYMDKRRKVRPKPSGSSQKSE